MRRGQVSVTAQRVAARRLPFPRVAADYGDPEADQRLGRDVAGPVAMVDQTSGCRYPPAGSATWPPNSRRIADSRRSAKSASPRELKRS